MLFGIGAWFIWQEYLRADPSTLIDSSGSVIHFPHFQKPSPTKRSEARAVHGHYAQYEGQGGLTFAFTLIRLEPRPLRAC
ncbi:hypothetical protein BVH03_24305 [Pseudomonas sp. PA15(2017)]|nr:hypothetical protein BVH03_24305 [Pseudomonas sp. PA15(2017)]